MDPTNPDPTVQWGTGWEREQPAPTLTLEPLLSVALAIAAGQARPPHPMTLGLALIVPRGLLAAPLPGGPIGTPCNVWNKDEPPKTLFGVACVLEEPPISCPSWCHFHAISFRDAHSEVAHISWRGFPSSRYTRVCAGNFAISRRDQVNPSPAKVIPPVQSWFMATAIDQQPPDHSGQCGRRGAGQRGAPGGAAGGCDGGGRPRPLPLRGPPVTRIQSHPRAHTHPHHSAHESQGAHPLLFPRARRSTNVPTTSPLVPMTCLSLFVVVATGCHGWISSEPTMGLQHRAPCGSSEDPHVGFS